MSKSKLGLKNNNSLKNMSLEDLRLELKTAKKELYILNMKHSLKELKQTHIIRLYKKYIARVTTFLKIS